MNRLVLLLVVCVIATPLEAGGVLYVDDDAAPGGDGTSWQSAHRYLSDALVHAAAAEEAVEIRVAQGLYIPDRSEASPDGTGDRYASFDLPDGVTLIGGYRGLSAGPGESPDDRDPEQVQSILSGDLLQNDTAPFENTEDNSLHVVTVTGTQFQDIVVEIDGIRIERGNANIEGDYLGGGVYARHSVLKFHNCTLRWNHGEVRGGAIRTESTDSAVNACHFYMNTSIEGAAIDQSVGFLEAENCQFIQNTAAKGGAICSGGGQFNIKYCDFTQNTVSQHGGAIYTDITTYNAYQCRFIENEAGQQGGAMFSPNSYGWIEDCTFEKNYAEIEGGAIDLASNGTTVVNCRFLSNNARWAGAASTVANVDFVNCLFVGNEVTENGGVLLADGPATMTNCTVVGNYAALDGGITYTWCCSPTLITNCIFEGNSVGPGGDLFWNLHDVAHSLVQEPIAGEGNIIADPQFVDPANDDYRLMPGSICVDRGYNPILTKIVENDLAGNRRFVDDPETPDTGVPDFQRPMIDFGAYEFCRGDADRNGVVDLFDLLFVLESWNRDIRLADTDGDGDVNLDDLSIVINYWGDCN